MDPRDQVVFVFQVVLALGPIAAYFLGLGLVNSQARPFLIGARLDFTLLASAFLPVVVVPSVSFLQDGRYWLAGGVLAAVAVLFVAMLPSRRFGWVVYNIGPEQWRRVLDRACRRAGWSVRAEGEELVIDGAGLRVLPHGLAWLRNVTLEVRGTDRAARERLREALQRELLEESMLPSPTGASLVVVGASLLGLPMWYLFNNMNAIVDVVRQILFA